MDSARAVLLLLTLALPLTALDGPLVELAADPLTVAPGARVTLTLAYRWPAGWVARDADPALAFTDLPVAECPPPVALRTGAEQRLTWTVVALAPAQPGPWALPQPGFTAIGPDGPRSVSAPLVLIAVGPALAPPTTAAARPLVSAPAAGAPSDRWTRAALLGLGLTVAGVAGWWWLGRPPRPPPTPAQCFHRDCTALEPGKPGASALGLALRRYLGAVHGFPGAGLTAGEAAERVRPDLPESEHTTLAALLGDLDDRRWAAPDLPGDALASARLTAAAWVDASESRRALATLAAASAAQPQRKRA